MVLMVKCQNVCNFWENNFSTDFFLAVKFCSGGLRISLPGRKCPVQWPPTGFCPFLGCVFSRAGHVSIFHVTVSLRTGCQLEQLTIISISPFPIPPPPPYPNTGEGSVTSASLTTLLVSLWRSDEEKWRVPTFGF